MRRCSYEARYGSGSAAFWFGLAASIVIAGFACAEDEPEVAGAAAGAGGSVQGGEGGAGTGGQMVAGGSGHSSTAGARSAGEDMPRAGSSGSTADGGPTDAGDAGVDDDSGSTTGDADVDAGAAHDPDPCVSAGAPREGCPCEPGTSPRVCDPPDLRTTQNGVAGTLVCTEGARYCRAAIWSECEIIWAYTTFVPD